MKLASMKASEIRRGDEMLLGQRFVGIVASATPSPFGMAVQYQGADSGKYRTVTIPADQDVHPIDGYEGRFFIPGEPEIEAHSCGSTTCDGGCHERTVEQFDRGQM